MWCTSTPRQTRIRSSRPRNHPQRLCRPYGKTREATQADPPPLPASPVGSADNPTTNVIKVVNNWVGKAAKELKIRLSNVNIKQDDSSTYAERKKEVNL